MLELSNIDINIRTKIHLKNAHFPMAISQTVLCGFNQYNTLEDEQKHIYMNT